MAALAATESSRGRATTPAKRSRGMPASMISLEAGDSNTVSDGVGSRKIKVCQTLASGRNTSSSQYSAMCQLTCEAGLKTRDEGRITLVLLHLFS